MSQSDVRKIIKAGELLNISTRGEFIFFKTGSSPIKTIVHNEPVEMEPGDVRRFTNKPFDEFIVKNDSATDQTVVFTVGFGDYFRNVVRGEISSFSSIVGSDGLPKTDDRFWLKRDVALSFESSITHYPFTPAETLTELGSLHAQANVRLIGEKVYYINGNHIEEYSKKGTLLRSVAHSHGGIVQTSYLFSGMDGGLYSASRGPTSWIFKIDLETLAVAKISEFDFSSSAQQFAVSGDNRLAVISNIEQVFVLENWQNSPVLQAEYALGDIIANPDKGLFSGDLDNLDAVLLVNADGNKGVSLNLTTGERTDLNQNYSAMTGSDWEKPRYFDVDWVNRRYLYNFGVVTVIPTKESTYWGKGFVLEPGARLKKNESEWLRKSETFGQFLTGNDWRVSVAQVLLEGYLSKLGKALPERYLDFVYAIKVNGQVLVPESPQSLERLAVSDLATLDRFFNAEILVSGEIQK